MSNKKTPSQKAEEYAKKIFPCEGPCNSWGVCSNCSDAKLLRIGFRAGYCAAVEDCLGIVKEYADNDFWNVQDLEDKIKALLESEK